MKKEELIAKCNLFNEWLDVSLLDENINKKPVKQPKNSKYCVWTDEDNYYAMEKVEHSNLGKYWTIICEHPNEEYVNKRLYEYLLAHHYAYLALRESIKKEKYEGIKTFGLCYFGLRDCTPVFILNGILYTQVVKNGIIIDFEELSKDNYCFVKKANTTSIKVAVGNYPIVAYCYQDLNQNIDIRFVGRKNDIQYLLKFYLNDERVDQNEKKLIREMIKK